jgi:hypothetical protein
VFFLLHAGVEVFFRDWKPLLVSRCQSTSLLEFFENADSLLPMEARLIPAIADAVAAVPTNRPENDLAGEVPSPEHGHQPLLPAYLPVSLAVLRQFLQRCGRARPRAMLADIARPTDRRCRR